MFQNLSDVLDDLRATSRPYLEFLRRRTMSAGLYVLSPGARDEQSPHDEDEIYVVLRGLAKATVAGVTHEVSEGSVIFVERHQEHRFHEIKDELQVFVLFVPAEGSTK